jgi:hypothetical protein
MRWDLRAQRFALRSVRNDPKLIGYRDADEFEICFESVDLIRYRPAFEGWHGRPGIVGTMKKSLMV